MLYLDRLITESKILQLIPGPVLLRQSEVVTKSYLWVELGKEVLKPMYAVCGNHCPETHVCGLWESLHQSSGQIIYLRTLSPFRETK